MSQDNGNNELVDTRERRVQDPETTGETAEDSRGRCGDAAALTTVLSALRSLHKAGDEEPPTKQPRRNTHVMRREAIMTLTQQIKDLEEELAVLRRRTLAVSQRTTTESERSATITNAILRETLLYQQYRTAAARSALSTALTADYAVPIQPHLHLPRNKTQRRKTLLALKPIQIDSARRFIHQRSTTLNLTRFHDTSEHVVNDLGDAVFTRFVVKQFHSPHSVQTVFDAISYHSLSVEFALMESDGFVTTREDDDICEFGVAQHRLVTTIASGLLLETNSVVFTEYEASSDTGLVVGRFVDSDELYPYKPKERLRHDVITIVVVSKLSESDEMVIVRRWLYTCQPRSKDLPLSDQMMRKLRMGFGKWADRVLEIVHEQLEIH